MQPHHPARTQRLYPRPRCILLMLALAFPDCGGAPLGQLPREQAPDSPRGALPEFAGYGGIPPTQGDTEAIRKRLQVARQALDHASSLDRSERADLAERLKLAETALSRYESLARQGRARRRYTQPLYVVGGIALADDTSVVGAIDDALLPVIGLGLLATYLTTRPPVPDTTLSQAWDGVLARLAEVGERAKALAMAKGGPQRVADTEIEEIVIAECGSLRNKDCVKAVLERLLAEAKAANDKARARRIEKTQKAFEARGSSHSKGGKGR